MTAIELLKKWREQIAADPELKLWDPVDEYQLSNNSAKAHNALQDASAEAMVAMAHKFYQAACLRIYDAAIARLEGEKKQ